MVRKRAKHPPPGWRWIYCKEFIHWISKKPVRRKNGGYFRFLVRA